MSLEGTNNKVAPPQADIQPAKREHPDLSELPCQCLQNVTVMLSEIENKSLMTETVSLDCTLAWQKKFLSRCNSILECAKCPTRPEYLLLLGLLAQSITNHCESSVNTYLEEERRQSTQHRTLDTESDSLASLESNNRTYLGQYAVESPQEWNSLMKVLILLQLQNVQSLLRGMKKARSSGPNAVSLPRVQGPCPTEQRLMVLIQRLGNSG